MKGWHGLDSEIWMIKKVLKQEGSIMGTFCAIFPDHCPYGQSSLH